MTQKVMLYSEKRYDFGVIMEREDCQKNSKPM